MIQIVTVDPSAYLPSAYLPSAYLLFGLLAFCLLPSALCYLLTTCRGGEMADATDLKSVDRKVVWVRLPPSAPIPII